MRLPATQTMADGIAVAQPGPVTYAHVAELVDDVVTVSEESLSRALLLCLERAKLVVEPAGSRRWRPRWTVRRSSPARLVEELGQVGYLVSRSP